MKNFTPERIPGSVELGEVECCALEHAFAKNPKTIAQLADVVGEKNMKLYPEELILTERLVIVPSENTKTVYSQIAKAELKRLAHENKDLSCGHSHEEHKKALESVEAMFSPAVN